jgi:hypothetical protein
VLLAPASLLKTHTMQFFFLRVVELYCRARAPLHCCLQRFSWSWRLGHPPGKPAPPSSCLLPPPRWRHWVLLTSPLGIKSCSGSSMANVGVLEDPLRGGGAADWLCMTASLSPCPALHRPEDVFLLLSFLVGLGFELSFMLTCLLEPCLRSILLWLVSR